MVTGPRSGCLLVFVLSVALTVLAYKKPTFCDQGSGAPFSFLWSVKKRDPPSYLFGTIHVPYTRVWEFVPASAKRAFLAAQRVFFELDLADPDTVAALATCQMLPGGQNLHDLLPGDLYSRLKRHLDHVRGLLPSWVSPDHRLQPKEGVAGGDADNLFAAIAGDWERKRPVWVTLMVNSLTEGEVRWRGESVLDLYLAREAGRMGKQTAAVERVEEQCEPLNSLDNQQVLFALNHTLLQRETDDRPYTTDDLVRHYNCGDLDSAVFGQSLPALANASLADSEEEARLAKSIDAYFKKELIDNRNRRMGSRVAELLRQNPGQSLFFAFGAGHFLGNNTVLDFVQEQGFEIEHLSVDAKIPKSKSKKIDQFEPDSNVPPPRKGRRSNRHRSLGSSFQRGHMFESTSSAPHTTQRSRHFNDLWVRMDTKTFVHPGTDDHHTPREAFQAWYQRSHGPSHIASSSGGTLSMTSLLLVTPLLLVTSLFLQEMSKHCLDLTGVT